MRHLFIILFIAIFVFSPSVVAHDQGFYFSELGWSDSLDGDMNYVANEGIFQRGSRAYAFVEVRGFANELVGQEYRHDLTVDVYLRSGMGIKLFGQKDVIEFQDLMSTWQDALSFYLWVDIPWWAPPVAYYAELVVRDRISGEEISHKEKLTIR